MATGAVNPFYIKLQKPYLIIIYTTEFLLSASWSFVEASIRENEFLSFMNSSVIFFYKLK